MTTPWNSPSQRRARSRPRGRGTRRRRHPRRRTGHRIASQRARTQRRPDGPRGDAGAPRHGGGTWNLAAVRTSPSSSPSSPARCALGRWSQPGSAGWSIGASDPRAGACGTLYNLCADPRLNHELPVTDGVRADECGALLTRSSRPSEVSDRRRQRRPEPSRQPDPGPTAAPGRRGRADDGPGRPDGPDCPGRPPTLQSPMAVWGSAAPTRPRLGRRGGMPGTHLPDLALRAEAGLADAAASSGPGQSD